MRCAVVAQRVDDDAPVRMVDGPHDRVCFAGFDFFRFGEHMDGRAVGVSFGAVQFVFDGEFGWYTRHHRMVGFDDLHREGAVLPVAPGASAHELLVVFRPVRPVVPCPRVSDHEPLARADEIKHALVQFRGGHRLVRHDAEYVERVEGGQDVRRHVGIGRMHTGFFEDPSIFLMKPPVEIVGGASSGGEDGDRIGRLGRVGLRLRTGGHCQGCKQQEACSLGGVQEHCHIGADSGACGISRYVSDLA